MKERVIDPIQVEGIADNTFIKEPMANGSSPLNQIEHTSLWNLIQNSGDAIITIDTESQIWSWNTAAESLFGLKMERVLNKPFSLFFELKTNDQTPFVFEQKINTGDDEKQVCVCFHNNGTQLNCTGHVVPLLNGDKKPIAYAILIKQKPIDEEAARDQSHASEETLYQQLNKYKNEFLVTISHELKTPLTVLKWYMESMDLKPDESFKMLMKKRSMQQLEKLFVLIDELLDMDKLDEGKLLLRITSFDIDKLISACVQNMLLIFDQHEIVYEKKAVLHTVLQADKTRIEQVLFNLLTNAIKYSPKKSTIYVYLQEEEHHFIISVKDHGMGIPEKYQKELFTKFFRIPDRERKIAGKGIGLYLCSEIIKRHGGKIWLACGEVNNCTFSFTIPKAPFN